MPAPDHENFLDLDVSVESGIAIVRSQEGGRRDDIEHSFITDLRDIFMPLGRDPDVRAVILAIENPPHTRTRLAPAMAQASLEQRAGRALDLQQLFASITTFRKPTVAAVTGRVHAIANIALLSDVVIASTSATFRDGHVRRGIAAGDGSTALWPLLLGPHLAKQVLLQGREITAQEGYALGFVSQVVEPDAVISTATRVAEQLGALPQVAYLATKLAMNNYFHLAALIGWDLAAAYEAVTLGEPDVVTRILSETGDR